MKRLGCTAVLIACASAPPASRPAEPPSHRDVAAPETRSELGPFTLVIPHDWVAKPFTSTMRVADFTVGSDAELIVYYFGESGAGSVDANVDRWLGQFTEADGSSPRAAAKIEQAKLAGQDATIVAVSGHYVAGAMPGSQAVDIPDAALLAAIVASPSGPYYWRLVGAKATVVANESKFRAMLASLALR
jgi:hypothetical protein